MSTRDDDATQPTTPRFSREAAEEARQRAAQVNATDRTSRPTEQAAGRTPSTGEAPTVQQPAVRGRTPEPQQAPAAPPTAPPTASTAADPYHDTSRFDATPLRQGTAPSPYRSTPSQPAGYDLSRRTSLYGSASSAPGYATAASAPYAASAAAAGAPAPQTATGVDGSGQPPYSGYPNGSAADSAAPRRRKQRRGPGWGGVIAATLAAAVIASGGTAAVVQAIDGDSSSTSSVATARSTALATGSTTKTVSSTQAAPDWEAVTSAVGNAVVAITVKTSSGTAEGSGVIYDSSGHVITNNHVVDGAAQIQVTLADGRIYSAKVTGTDPATDLAVVELENAPSDLTVAQFGDSDSVATGEDVMAIGNPLGLSSTATTGIVSALNRPVVTTTTESDSSQGQSSGGLGDLFGQSQDQSQSQSQSSTDSSVYTNAIQIDAAINPGNSGGPLFDESGKVIGITSSIASMSSSSSSESGSIGIGFAIPSNLVQKVSDQLIKSGTATHAYLGVSIGDGSSEVDGATRAGAEVGSVESDSPASKAGLAEGDVITAIDGKPTTQAAALTGFVRQYSAGDTATLTVIRDGKEISVQATLSERKDS
ncbi:S1C family serine protease [Actinomyces radicidentis]|uniref:S1C family serine protease n=1 Tax=Actinomyces radicidentis TaxID=111015 RepID=UPI000A079311|nr:trypsin-like peptidase domain-containing protein [Actinomyces radicidentis]